MQHAANTPTTSTLCFSAPAAEETIQAPGDDVRHVRATLAKGKEHTHCFPSARVLCFCTDTRDPEGDESLGSVVLHAGVNDTKLWQTETLKRDFRSLIETVRSTSSATAIIVSGPHPTNRRGHERFSRLFALN